MNFNSNYFSQRAGEIYIPENVMPVSKSNLQGIITEVNQDLIDICGCDESQLLGQTTISAILHPDVPSEVKNDIWLNLRKNRPWTGITKIKNYKDDSYCWTIMAITPINDNGVVSGYLSSYRQANSQQISLAEEAYRSIRDNPTNSPFIIQHGKIINKQAKFFSLSNWVNNNLTIRKKIIFGMFICIFFSLLIAAVSIWSVQKRTDEMSKEFEEISKHNQALNEMNKLNLHSISQLLLALQHDPNNTLASMHDHPLSLHFDKIHQNIKEIEKLKQNLVENVTLFANHEDKKQQEILILEKIKQTQHKFIVEGLQKAIDLIEKHQNYREANLLILRIRPLYTELSNDISELNRLQQEATLQNQQSLDEAFSNFRLILLGLLVLSLLLSLYISSLIIKSISNPLNEMAKTLLAIAHGDYSRNVDVSSDDEIGKLMQGLQSMQIQAGYQRAEEKRINHENARVKFALNCANANMMVLDKNAKIVFMNESMLNHSRKIESSLLQSNPTCNTDSVINTHLEPFILNAIVNSKSNTNNVVSTNCNIRKHTPEYQHLVDQLNNLQKQTLMLEFGGFTFLYNINPINDEKGQRLGTVMELIDKTAEVTAQQQVTELVGKAVAGNLEARFDLNKLEGFYRDLGENFNNLLENCNTSINDLGLLLECMAEGDLTHTIDLDKYQGSFYLISKDANSSVIRLRELLNDIRDFAETINSAVIEIAAGNRDLSTRTEKQASSLQETSSSMDELTSTVCQNAESAHKANELTHEMEKLAADGKIVVNQVVETMTEIDQFSQHISEIIGVIDGIAFQTNILALNAAVEAARAGEQGRGFAVVASEVRSLAQRCASSAKEIKELISNAVEKIELGNEQAQKAGITTEKINESIKHVSVLITDIANASQEQSLGIAQVSQAVTQMDEVTQHNTVLVEQATTAAESLEEQAQNLIQAVAAFRLLDNQSSFADSHKKSLEKFHSSKFSGKNSIEKNNQIINTHFLPKLGVNKNAFNIPNNNNNSNANNTNKDLDDEWEEF